MKCIREDEEEDHFFFFTFGIKFLKKLKEFRGIFLYLQGFY